LSGAAGDEDLHIVLRRDDYSTQASRKQDHKASGTRFLRQRDCQCIAAI